MRKLILLSAISAAACGCSAPWSFLAPESPTDKTARSLEVRPAIKPPVVVDQVSGENAKDKAKALNDEIDRDLQAAIEARDRAK
jgi:hypothetical protein